MPRPRTEDRDLVLSERLPTIQVSQREKEGARWLAGQRAAELRKEGVGAAGGSVSSVLRWLLRRELQARGFNPDAKPGEPPDAPDAGAEPATPAPAPAARARRPDPSAAKGARSGK